MKIAIISDIHEDIVNLEKALRKIDKIVPDKVVCLGDISGFSVPHYQHQHTRDAHLCLDLIRQNCDIIIPGNHDLNASKRIPAISPDFHFPENWYHLDYHEKRKLSNDKLWLYEEDELDPMYSYEDIDFLTTLDEVVLLRDNHINILFTHYAYPNISGMSRTFYFDNEDFVPHFNFMSEHKASISIIGHTHPEGLIYFTKSRIFDNSYKKRILPPEEVCIITPSVTNAGKPNGFLVLETENIEVEAVKI